MLHAQTESKTLDSVAREQQNIKDRLEHIRTKMERLERKNEREGGRHTADVIRRARAEMEKRDILKRTGDLDTKIRASLLTVGKEQELLLKDLEDIFAILQDRNDLERLNDMIKAFDEGVRTMGRLIDDQEKVLNDTRGLLYDKTRLTSEALEKLKEIIEGQKELAARVNDAGGRDAEEDTLWSIAEAIDDLAAAQEELAKRACAGEDAAKDEELSFEEMIQTQGGLAGRLDKIEERIRKCTTGGGTEVAEEARDALSNARQEMEKASAELRERRALSGAGHQENAAGALREASGLISGAGRDEFREKKRRDMDMAGRQEMLGSNMEEVRDTLERIESLSEKRPGEGSSADSAKMPEKAEDVQKEMENARSRLWAGELERAAPHQANAAKQLEELVDLLEKSREAGSGPESGSTASSAEQKERFEELAKREKELEERTRDLMRRMREVMSKEAMRNLSDSADNMARAVDELANRKGEDAERDEEEAKKLLEKARKEMDQEENKYHNIRQREVLFRVQQSLENLKEEQDKINDETRAIDISGGEDSRPTRLNSRKLRKLSVQEQEVKAKTAEVREKIEEDSSTVFSWVLERNEEDLGEVVDMLGKQNSGALVQAIQSDISGRFEELIESLKQELKRRMEALSEEQEPSAEGGGQPGSKNPLIPPVAELLMIKGMEEGAMRRLKNFTRLHPEMLDGNAGPMDIRMLERMGHMHSNITELFKKMIERSKGGAPDVEPLDEKK